MLWIWWELATIGGKFDVMEDGPKNISLVSARLTTISFWSAQWCSLLSHVMRGSLWSLPVLWRESWQHRIGICVIVYICAMCRKRVRRRDCTIVVSLGCPVSLQTSSFWTYRCHLIPNSIRGHRWWKTSNCASVFETHLYFTNIAATVQDRNDQKRDNLKDKPERVLRRTHAPIWWCAGPYHIRDCRITSNAIVHGCNQVEFLHSHASFIDRVRSCT